MSFSNIWKCFSSFSQYIRRVQSHSLIFSMRTTMIELANLWLSSHFNIGRANLTNPARTGLLTHSSDSNSVGISIQQEACFHLPGLSPGQQTFCSHLRSPHFSLVTLYPPGTPGMNLVARQVNQLVFWQQESTSNLLQKMSIPSRAFLTATISVFSD